MFKIAFLLGLVACTTVDTSNSYECGTVDASIDASWQTCTTKTRHPGIMAYFPGGQLKCVLACESDGTCLAGYPNKYTNFCFCL